MIYIINRKVKVQKKDNFELSTVLRNVILSSF